MRSSAICIRRQHLAIDTIAVEKCASDFNGPIPRTVVDNDHLDVVALLSHTVEGFFNPWFCVEHRHNDTDFHWNPKASLPVARSSMRAVSGGGGMATIVGYKVSTWRRRRSLRSFKSITAPHRDALNWLTGSELCRSFRHTPIATAHRAEEGLRDGDGGRGNGPFTS
jgi:hypothetical protein